MGDGTSISWTDATWNPIRGCRRTATEGSKQSGCGDPTGGGCYAERQAARFCGKGQAYEGLIKLTANGPRWSGKTKFVEEHLMDPIRWRDPRRIFTDSMSDLFYDGFDDDEIDQVVAVMFVAAHQRGHIFQTLTKRPRRMRDYFNDPMTIRRVAKAAGRLFPDVAIDWTAAISACGTGLTHPRLWWGTSVENQAAADERIPDLLATPAAIRFISAEPLLGPVDLTRIGTFRGEPMSALEEQVGHVERPRLNWIICGCESGPNSRPCDYRWIRQIRDQCKAAGVAMFLKQARNAFEDEDDLREAVRKLPSLHGVIQPRWVVTGGEGSRKKGGGIFELPYLDGVQHKAFPEVGL